MTGVVISVVGVLVMFIALLSTQRSYREVVDRQHRLIDRQRGIIQGQRRGLRGRDVTIEELFRIAYQSTGLGLRQPAPRGTIGQA